jgi:excisionase family DNA binding protein
METEVLTVRETAQRLRVHERTVRRLIADRELEVIRVGGAIRIPEDAIEALRHPAMTRGELSAGLVLSTAETGARGRESRSVAARGNGAR